MSSPRSLFSPALFALIRTIYATVALALLSKRSLPSYSGEADAATVAAETVATRSDKRQNRPILCEVVSGTGRAEMQASVSAQRMKRGGLNEKVKEQREGRKTERRERRLQGKSCNEAWKNALAPVLTLPVIYRGATPTISEERA